jgi:hypothetical protein
MADDNSGVVRVLDDDELLDEDGRLSTAESELNDETRDVGEQDLDDGDSDASDVVGLTPRCAMLLRLGERSGRRATFLRTTAGVCGGGTREAGGELGLGERNGWRREDGAETAGIWLECLDIT